jgi:hypothetical protein
MPLATPAQCWRSTGSGRHGLVAQTISWAQATWLGKLPGASGAKNTVTSADGPRLIGLHVHGHCRTRMSVVRRPLQSCACKLAGVKPVEQVATSNPSEAHLPPQLAQTRAWIQIARVENQLPNRGQHQLRGVALNQ